MDATCEICSFDSVSFEIALSDAVAASTPASMPRLRDIGFAPAATLRSPSRTMAQASTVAVVVPSPATSSVFFATSFTSSAPTLSQGSSRSISLAMDTPSFVIVGAPHFFSSTTLRPLGPRVTRTASASLFIPLSRDRRASSSKAISLDIPGFLRTFAGGQCLDRHSGDRPRKPSCRGRPCTGSPALLALYRLECHSLALYTPEC